MDSKLNSGNHPSPAELDKENRDLDLIFITDNIVAMGLPRTTRQTVYKAHVDSALTALQSFEKKQYIFWNVSDRKYDFPKLFDFGWDSSTCCPPLQQLFQVVQSVDSWIKETDNVAVIQGKAGTGRIGFVISAVLLYSGGFVQPDAAMTYFEGHRATSRVHLGGGGPINASQMRYLTYFAEIVRGIIPSPTPIILCRVILNGIPAFTKKAGCKPYLNAYSSSRKLFSAGKGGRTYFQDDMNVSIVASDTAELSGDVVIKFKHAKGMLSVEMFRCQFHTGFMDSVQHLRLFKQELDMDEKDKPCLSDDFFLDLFFVNAAQARRKVQWPWDNMIEDHKNRGPLVLVKLLDIPTLQELSPAAHSKGISVSRIFKKVSTGFKRLATKQEKTWKLFGGSLQEAIRHPNQRCARIVDVCCDWLVESGMEKEGLFRIPGEQAAIQKLKVAFESDDEAMIQESLVDVVPHAVASVLKLYYRLLLEPLIPFDYYQSFIKLAEQNGTDEAIEGLQQLFQQFPQVHLDALARLCQFLHLVAEKSEINKMNTHNLAIVFAPNIAVEKDQTAGSMLQDMPISIQGIELLIGKSDLFFPEIIESMPREAAAAEEQNVSAVPSVPSPKPPSGSMPMPVGPRPPPPKARGTYVPPIVGNAMLERCAQPGCSAFRVTQRGYCPIHHRMHFGTNDLDSEVSIPSSANVNQRITPHTKSSSTPIKSSRNVHVESATSVKDRLKLIQMQESKMSSMSVKLHQPPSPRNITDNSLWAGSQKQLNQPFPKAESPTQSPSKPNQRPKPMFGGKQEMKFW